MANSVRISRTIRIAVLLFLGCISLVVSQGLPTLVQTSISQSGIDVVVGSAFRNFQTIMPRLTCSADTQTDSSGRTTHFAERTMY